MLTHVRNESGAASATTVLPRIAEGTTAARASLPARAAAHTRGACVDDAPPRSPYSPLTRRSSRLYSLCDHRAGGNGTVYIIHGVIQPKE
jgi:hypothetical protein